MSTGRATALDLAARGERATIRAGAARTPPTTTNESTLDAFFSARAVAVIGASERPGSVGAAVFQNLLGGGFSGAIVPVNPRMQTIAGRPAIGRIADARSPIDLAVICTPAATVPGLVQECGEAGVRGVLILSAGFRETGSDGIALERKVCEARPRWPTMRVLGPNCLGFLVPAIGLNASFARDAAKPGGIAFLSQSGALCTSILAWAREEDVGFSHFVSTGNMLDVGFGDLLAYVAEQPQVTSVILYVEAITDAPRFLAAARRCAALKPIIAYKAGRHAAGAKAAASHTGALAGEDAVYQAAFDETGIVRVDRLDELLGTAQMLASRRRPTGPRLAIVTNAGGPGVIATDALASGGGGLAELSAGSLRALDAALPPHWSHANPVDVIGDAGPDRLSTALNIVLNDDAVDAVLVIVTPQATVCTSAAATAVASVTSRQRKPVFTAWMTGAMDHEARAALRAGDIPIYSTPEQAVGAFLSMAACIRRRPRSAELVDREQVQESGARRELRESLRGKPGTLNEHESKRLFSAYGIRIAETLIARTRDQAVTNARTVGYPVALKLDSAQITHKTEVGGIALDLRSDADVTNAFDRIRDSLAAKRPDAAFEGVTVQRMVDRSRGVEFVVGARRDPTFGPIVLVGAGGTMTEVLADRAIALAPVTAARATELVRSLRIAQVLGSFRGRPALDESGLVAAICGLSRLIVEMAGVREAEANPVLVTPETTIALDARVIRGATAE